ncbi:ATP-dependent Lon protease [Vibrio maritimus]|uniref:ATP-dependent Lon protease n=1 Tax=Vibrio maritimus TaxID=990268 RepID=UPI003735B229
MIVSPNSVSAPVIAPSVNPQTEQAARDNKVREPIVPTVEMARTNAERRINEEEKRRKRTAWDPAEHPEYDTEEDVSDNEDPIERLFHLLSLNTYSESQGKGYAMRFRLPPKIMQAALMKGRMAKRRTVIRYHYGHSVAPNTPSDIIAVG